MQERKGNLQRPGPDTNAFILKACDVASAQLLDEHKRIQSEIYQRIAYRQRTLEHFFISGGIFLGAISYLIKEYIGKTYSILSSIASISFLCISLLGFSFICAVLFNNYITHSGHIYTAAFYVCDHLEKGFQRIMHHVQSPLDAEDRLNLNVFKWEYVLCDKRERYKFHDRFGDENLLLAMPFVMLLCLALLLTGFLFESYATRSMLWPSWIAFAFASLGTAVGWYHYRTFGQYKMLREFRNNLPDRPRARN